jgi:hypothetical protein
MLYCKLRRFAFNVRGITALRMIRVTFHRWQFGFADRRDRFGGCARRCEDPSQP